MTDFDHNPVALPDDDFSLESANSIDRRGVLLEAEKERILKSLEPPHVVARTSTPDTYPKRSITEKIVSFDDPNYKPTYFADPKIYGFGIQTPKWASPLPVDPEQLSSFIDALDRNPYGPTGIVGPGELGKTVNWAADPIVLSVDPNSGDIYQIQIQRSCGSWAIPGGMVDSGEVHLSTSLRELEEETGVILEDHTKIEIYKGYVDDPRNTDTHYICSSVFLFMLDFSEAKKISFSMNDPAEGIKDIRLRKITEHNINNTMYANHSDFTKLALIHIGLNRDRLTGLDNCNKLLQANIKQIIT